MKIYIIITFLRRFYNNYLKQKPDIRKRCPEDYYVKKGLAEEYVHSALDLIVNNIVSSIVLGLDVNLNCLNIFFVALSSKLLLYVLNNIVNSKKYSFIKEENWGGHNTGASWSAADVEVLPETNAFTALIVNPECILGFNVKSSYNPHSESAIAAHHTRLANPFGTYAASTCARIDDRLYDKISADDFRKDGWYPAEIVNFKYLDQTPATVASYCAMKFGATYGLSESDGKTHTTKDAAVGINDFCKFRYSEVVLMLAEAYARNGNDGQAKATLNTLLAARTRTGATTLTCDNYPSMNGLSALQMVQLQYRIEMWGENGREYYNNKRWGINVDRSGSSVHVQRSYTLDANTMVCDIIEEETQNNPNW